MSTPVKPSSNPIDDAFERYKRHAVDDRGKIHEKPAPSPQVSTRLAWVSSLVIGAGMGLVFGLTSQVLNLLLIPGIPLAPAPFGLVGNLLLYLILGTLIGLFSNLNNRAQGIIIGVLLATDFVMFLRSVSVRQDSVFQMLLEYLLPSFFFLGATFLAIFLILPVGMLIRWAVNTQCENFYRPWWSIKRLSLPIILFALAGIAGALFLYSPEERYGVKQMNTLVQAGLAATSEDRLPPALKNMTGAKFWQNAQGSYSIRAEREVTGGVSVRGLYSGANSLHTTAFFKNGYSVTCGVDSSGAVVNCKSSGQSPTR